jgi:hypothetical protein
MKVVCPFCSNINIIQIIGEATFVPGTCGHSYAIRYLCICGKAIDFKIDISTRDSETIWIPRNALRETQC